MVALEIVVDVDLPVARDLVVHRPKSAHALERQRAALLGDRGDRLRQRRRLRIEVDEQHPAPFFDAKLRQPVRGAVEVPHAVPFGRRAQSPVEPVGPAVIPASQGHRPARGARHGSGPMAADVRKRPTDPVLAPRHDDRLSPDVAREVVAGHRRRSGRTDELPGAREDPLLLASERLGLEIRRRRRRLGGREVRLEAAVHAGPGGPAAPAVCRAWRASRPPRRMSRN